MKLAQLGEFGFIERLRRRAAAGPGVRLGIGDDCAALELPPGELLLTTTDLLIEEIHFRRDWSDLRLVGRKSVSVNVSDLAAMGGTPRYLYLALGLPGESTVEELDAFMAGFLEQAAAYGATLVGGDTCRSPGPWLISVTAEGSVPEAECVSRGGARPGDDLYVSGTLGDSALALRALASGEEPEASLARRHFDPQARVALGRALATAQLPTAMIDLSDGLLADLGHMLASSHCGAELAFERIPFSDPFRQALALDSDVVDLALAGGEDYELLFAVPPQRRAEVEALGRSLQLPLSRIGTLTATAGEVVLRGADGQPMPLPRKGYDHFAPSR